MNETLRVIAERYTCRAYEDRLPEREKLDAIALAAVQSPSAMNLQRWQILVIVDKGLIDDMDREAMFIISQYEDKTMYDRFMERGGKMFYNAPCVYLILQQPKSDLDTGIVSENIALAATSLGLGNCICGMFRFSFMGERAKEFLAKLGYPDGFPEGWEFGMSVLVGYEAKVGTPHEPDLGKVRFV